MTNRDVMKKHLLEKVCKPLLAEGFTGKFPHYRRACDKTIELVTFQTNKDGGSFTVEVSAVFPHRKNTNCAEEIIDPATVTVWNTNERYRLSGMFDGWFYYRDVYEKRIFGLGKTYFDIDEKSTALPFPKCRLVQKFDEERANDICCEINKQLIKAFRWLAKFEKKKQNA